MLSASYLFSSHTRGLTLKVGARASRKENRDMQKRITLPILTTLFLSSSLALPAFAQATGTAHPESLDDSITVSRPQPVAKPSPAVAMPAPALQVRSAVTATPASPVADIPSVVSSSPVNDDNEGIVTGAPSGPNELPEGTLIRVKLSQEISTRDTEPNIRFNAFLSAPLMKLGNIAVPAGSVLTGRITGLSSGHHLGKAAGIQLQPEFITLPDGAHYRVEGQVIDLFADHHTHVTREGTINGNDSTPGTATAVGAATGTGAIAGAILGGGVGAVVGAGIGAGVSGAVWMNQETSSTLRAGTEIIFSLNRPMLLKNASITSE
jgi:hypothetical protein